jgi:aryl-alcohol dehydrogenase-like predicted oxidoreductase
MGGWTGSDDEQSMRSLQRAVDLGCTFFDTAWGYGEGHSEGLLGDLVRANPDTKLYTATKIPPKNMTWPSERGFSLDDCFPPDHIEAFVHHSLKNAGLDAFDLMQFHVWEDAWADDDRWATKMDDLRSQGLFHAIGISINRWEPWNGVRTVRSGLIDAVQVIYNIFDLNNETVSTIIPGMRKLRHVEANMAASDKGPLPYKVHQQLRDHRWDREPTEWSQ